MFRCLYATANVILINNGMFRVCLFLDQITFGKYMQSANLQAFEEPGAGSLLLWEEMGVSSIACFASVRLEKKMVDGSCLCRNLAINQHRT